MIRVAAYQGLPESTIKLRYEQICRILSNADANDVDIICFPEGFLTGYYDDKLITKNNSLHIHDLSFTQFLETISGYRATVIIGFNECEGENLFDSAAVIERGILLGVQRKHYRYHDFCSSGSDFSMFVSKAICFGVVVCLDANYFEPSRLCALQGASILFVPACNKVAPEHSFSQRPLYYSHFVARSHENRCWLVSADWIWQNDGKLICPGHTVVYDADGQEVARSREFVEDMLMIDIPKKILSKNKGVRVYGSKSLWSKIDQLIC